MKPSVKCPHECCKRTEMRKSQKCDMQGCDKPARQDGIYCTEHSQELPPKQTSTVIPPPPKPRVSGRRKKVLKEAVEFFFLWMMVGSIGFAVIGILLFHIDYHYIAATSNPLFSAIAQIVIVPTSILRETFEYPVNGTENSSLLPYLVKGAVFAGVIAIFMIVIPTISKLKKMK